MNAERIEILKQEASNLESIVLDPILTCDFEMIANGGFAPLDRFMGKADYESVLSTMRLANGSLFPVPVTLPVDKEYKIGLRVALRDACGALLAVMTIEDRYAWDKKEYGVSLLGSYDTAHPFIPVIESWGAYNISGPLEIIALPQHEDFKELRLTPEQVRAKTAESGNKNLVAFQTRNPLHRVHEELTKRAAVLTKATLLLQPVIGLTKPGDVDYVTRVRCYKALVNNYYDGKKVILSLIPLAMRMAGPREALWHAIIRKNYGATHFIVGRDHAGLGNNSLGEPFYKPYQAQKLTLKYADEIGIKILTFGEMVYIKELDNYKELSAVKKGETVRSISGTQVREEYLALGKPLPGWFTRPEVAKILADTNVPRIKQGFCLWFTGLSASGKSTIARAVENKLNESGRKTTILDGDIVRRHLSKGLSFSREDRDENVKRIGYVASQVVKHDGIAICSVISPYRETRDVVRQYFELGRFIEVYMSTPLETCEARDPKGLYSLARQGKIHEFTGIDDVYEASRNPEIEIDTSVVNVDEAVQIVLEELASKGFYVL